MSTRRHPAWLLGVLLSSACDGVSGSAALAATSETASPRIDPDSILWAGCASVVDHRVCEVGDEPITVWAPYPSSALRWRLDGEAITPEHTEPVLDGVRATISVEAVGREGATLALSGTGEGSAWTVELRPYRLDPDRFSFGERLKQARASKDQDERLAFVRVLAAEDDAMSPRERLARLRAARRLAYDKRDIGASAARVEPLLERVVAAAASLGRWGEQCGAATTGLFLATHNWSPSRAAHWRRWEEPCRSRGSYWGVAFDYYLGVLSTHQGRYSEAARRLGRARRDGQRLGLVFEDIAWKRQIELLARTARWSEAKRELQAFEQRPMSRCARALLDSEIGFYRLVARQSGDGDLGDPSVPLERALALHDGECENLTASNHDRIKLGFVAALRHDQQALARRIGELELDTLRGANRGQYWELRATDALARGSPVDARHALARMEAELLDGMESSARWRMHMLYAELAEHEGDTEASIRAYRDAESVIDGLLGDVRSGALREHWLHRYRSSAIMLVERQLDQHRLELAACSARRARARALALHDAAALDVPSRGLLESDATETSSVCQRKWGHTSDELVLLLFPRHDDRWWAFEIRNDSIQRVHELGRLPDRQCSPADDHFWDRWSSSLRQITRVRILASEASLAVPFHCLGWNGDPLATQRAVVYGLDLGPAQQAPDHARPSTIATVAFVDADPLRTLERYAPLVAEVDAALSSAGWSSQWVEADAFDIRTLFSSQLLHLYGHGARRGLDAGEKLLALEDVGTTALLLPKGRDLRVAEVLRQPRVPRWVVLMGCRLSHLDLYGWNGGLSLAHAFLLAGAEQVIASSSLVDAQAAAELGLELYEGMSPDDFELADAMMKVWKDERLRDEADHPWRALRVWSR